MDNLNNVLLPEYRGSTWVDRWMRDWNKSAEGEFRKINEEVIPIIQDRIDVIINRFEVHAEDPFRISLILNGVARKYNGLIYEENGVIMEIDLFEDEIDEDEESFLFGLGNTHIFNKYIFDYFPELLI